MADANQVAGSNKQDGSKQNPRENLRDFTGGKSEGGPRGGGSGGRDFGSAAEQLSDRLPDMARTAQEKIADTVQDVASVASDRAGQAARWLKTKSEGAFERSDVALTRAREYVKEYPLRTLAIGVAVGCLAGWFLSNRNYDRA